MGELDLDAIKARASAAAKPAAWLIKRPSAEAVLASAADVPALLARVAELETERDEARRERDEMAQRIAAEEADLDEIYAKMRAHETCPRCGGQLRGYYVGLDWNRPPTWNEDVNG